MRTKIGLVEDDDQVRDQFAQAIANSESFEIWFETGSMHSAMEWMSHCPAGEWPTLWLVDLGLSDGDGMSVIRHAMTLHPDTRVMVVSAFGDEATVLDCISQGASGYILKGVGELQIHQHIDDLLSGGSPLSPQIARHVLNRLCRHDGRRPPLPPRRMADRTQTHGAAGASDSLLTSRQRDVLDWIARGYSYEEISNHLQMGTNTVRTHIRKIYAKLGVHSKVDAINEAHRISLLQVAHDTGPHHQTRPLGASSLHLLRDRHCRSDRQ